MIPEIQVVLPLSLESKDNKDNFEQKLVIEPLGIMDRTLEFLLEGLNNTEELNATEGFNSTEELNAIKDYAKIVALLKDYQRLMTSNAYTNITAMSGENLLQEYNRNQAIINKLLNIAPTLLTHKSINTTEASYKDIEMYEVTNFESSVVNELTDIVSTKLNELINLTLDGLMERNKKLYNHCQTLQKNMSNHKAEPIHQSQPEVLTNGNSPVQTNQTRDTQTTPDISNQTRDIQIKKVHQAIQRLQQSSQQAIEKLLQIYPKDLTYNKNQLKMSLLRKSTDNISYAGRLQNLQTEHENIETKKKSQAYEPLPKDALLSTTSLEHISQKETKSSDQNKKSKDNKPQNNKPKRTS